MVTILTANISCSDKMEIEIERERVDERGKYVPKKIYNDEECEGDYDCLITDLREGDCCPEQCEKRAANRKWVRRKLREHKKLCRNFYIKKDFTKMCGWQLCKKLEKEPVAKCRKGKCKLEWEVESSIDKKE